MIKPEHLNRLRQDRANARTRDDPLGIYWVGGYNAAASQLSWWTIDHMMALRRQWAVPGMAAAARQQVEQVAGLTMTDAQALAWLDGVEAVGRLV